MTTQPPTEPTDQAIALALSRQTYWLLLNDATSRDQMLTNIWYALPYSTRYWLQACNWGIAERGTNVRSLVFFLAQKDCVMKDSVEHHAAICRTVYALTAIPELRIYGRSLAVSMTREAGVWVLRDLSLPSDWNEQDGGL